MQEYSPSKALYHTDKLKQIRDGSSISPTEIQVDLEAFCNDNCSFCSYRKDDGYNNEMLKLIGGTSHTKDRPIGRPSNESRIPERFKTELPKQMVQAGIPAIELTGGGEPTLWPWFDELLENLGEAKREVALVTNGSQLTEKRIELVCKYCLWVRISMDASNGATHKKVHRTGNDDFERRIQSIKKLVKQKPAKLVLGISFIINQDNYDDIETAAKYYAKLGVDNIRFSWMYDSTGTSGLTQYQIDSAKSILNKLQNSIKIIHYDTDRVDLYTKPNDDFSCCHFQKFVWAIGADCKVYPCCIVKYFPNASFGNLEEQSLSELVHDNYVKSKMDNLDVKKCPPCWLRNKNKSIESAITKPTHENFI